MIDIIIGELNMENEIEKVKIRGQLEDVLMRHTNTRIHLENRSWSRARGDQHLLCLRGLLREVREQAEGPHSKVSYKLVAPRAVEPTVTEG